MPEVRVDLVARVLASRALVGLLIVGLVWSCLPWSWASAQGSAGDAEQSGNDGPIASRNSYPAGSPAGGPLAFLPAEREDPEVVDDAVILLDITGSMLGEGPDSRAQNLWEQVVPAVLNIVDRLAPGTNLAIVPFATGPSWRGVYPGPLTPGSPLTLQPLASQEVRDGFKRHLQQLVADGQATWIYESVEYVLAELQRQSEADPDRVHRQSVYLYTDGIDNGPHASQGVDGLARLFRERRSDSLYAVYNDLGAVLTAEQRKVLERSQVLVTTGPPRSSVELLSGELDFGDLSLSPEGATRELVFSSRFADVWDKPVDLRLEFAGLAFPLALSPERAPLSERITVTLRPTSTLPLTRVRGKLVVEPVDGAFVLIPRNTVDLRVSAVAMATATAEARATAAAWAQATADARAMATAQARATATALADATLRGNARASATAAAYERQQATAAAEAFARIRATSTAEALAWAQATATALARPTRTPTPVGPAPTKSDPFGFLSLERLADLARSLPVPGLAAALVGLVAIAGVAALRNRGSADRPPSECQLLWAAGEPPKGIGDPSVGHRILRPRNRQAPESWTIGTAGDIALPDDDPSLKRIHARISYGGRNQPEFRLSSAGGEVKVRDTSVGSDGVVLVPRTVFLVGSYYFLCAVPGQKGTGAAGRTTS